MNFVRRTSLAAAMSLLPLATALVASPAAAQHQRVATYLSVGSLALNADAGLAPGSTLKVELSASPGAHQVEVLLGDSGARVLLHERHAGQYVGRYVVRQSDRIDPLQALTARVVRGDAAVVRNFSYPAAFRALASDDHRGRGHRRWDRQAPTIGAVTPEPGEHVRDRGVTRITARIADVGSGVDPASMVLRVDGHDVTDNVRLRDDQLRYRADLAPGRHTAELLVRDRAGNASNRSWSFDVVPQERYGYYDDRPR